MLHPAIGILAMFVLTAPEPSGIPELCACLVGIGYLAWRRRKGKS